MPRLLGAGGPDYNLVRRFFSRPLDEDEPGFYHCFSVCEYCGDMMARGVPGVVCCHERAVRQEEITQRGEGAGSGDDYRTRSKPSPFNWIAFITLAVTMWVIWRGISQ